MSCLLCGDGAEVKTGVCGTEVGMEGIWGRVRGGEMLYCMSSSIEVQQKHKRWDVVHTNPNLPNSIQLNFKRLSHFEA